MDSPENNKHIPLFLPRKGIGGWDLNPEHKYYYIAIGIILAIPFAVVGLCFFI